jgi:hypothetical protein
VRPRKEHRRDQTIIILLFLIIFGIGLNKQQFSQQGRYSDDIGFSKELTVMRILRMTRIEGKTIEFPALIKLCAIVIETIVRKFRPAIGIIIKQGDGTEPAIDDDDF